MYRYEATIVRVIDGDTVVVDIDLGFEVWLTDQYIRLEAIDSPEVRTKDLEEKEAGLAAKSFVEQTLMFGQVYPLVSKEYHAERGKYGRIIGDIELPDGQLLTEALLENGHAVPYEK